MRLIVSILVGSLLAIAFVASRSGAPGGGRQPTTTDEILRSFQRGVSAREEGAERLSRPNYPHPLLRRAWDQGWDLADRVLTEPSRE